MQPAYKVLFSLIGIFFILELINLYAYRNPPETPVPIPALNEFAKLEAQISIIPTPAPGKKKKLILFGSNWWGSHFPYVNDTKDVCPQCDFTENLDLFNISDAVIFNALTIPKKPPKNRPKGQIWIWYMLESYQTRNDAANYGNMINWTMTYRKDSDIFIPYGRVISIHDIPRPPFNQTWAYIPDEVTHNHDMYEESLMKAPTEDELKDRKLIAWINSKCHDVLSLRGQIVEGLRKYVTIDEYGKCGKFKCQIPRHKTYTSGNVGINCRLNISKKYKFYLGLENNLCEDYVTEKLFDTMYMQMVPIVYGGANYSEIAPKGSYINVGDFKSIKSLADYLIFLDNNPKEYLKYFEWRKDYWVQNNGFLMGYCDLCKKLLAKDPPMPKVYADVKTWWNRRSDYEVSKKLACNNPSNRTIFETEDWFKFYSS